MQHPGNPTIVVFRHLYSQSFEQQFLKAFNWPPPGHTAPSPQTVKFIDVGGVSNHHLCGDADWDALLEDFELGVMYPNAELLTAEQWAEVLGAIVEQAGGRSQVDEDLLAELEATVASLPA